MSYLQYSNFYRQMVLSGKLPYPNFYPYVSPSPNLSNQDCNSNLLAFKDLNCIFNTCRDPLYEKYDYLLYDIIPYQDPSSAMNFIAPQLVSNVVDAAINFDINLSNPWGIIIINDIVWVANADSGLLTSYDLLGRRLLSIVNVFGPVDNIAMPTGIFYNDNLNIFPLVNGPLIGPSTIIMVTRDGTINGYNKEIYPNNSILVVDNSEENSVYTGLEIIGSVIYAVDFYNQKIDVYDGTFNKLLTYPFIDDFGLDPIPPDFAPYNIKKIGDFLYITYARQSPFDNQYELPGTGYGFISIFTFDGIFVKRFASRGVLNAPWGIVPAPTQFRYPPGSIMVGNFGDGIINIYCSSGQYLDQLKDEFNNIISIDGLRGLFVNENSQIIYWTASADNLRTALVGTINYRRIG
ncbi:MAG: hypothetical protein Satyrvirus1_58 [Satyrvirus sp.]|uniref:TIGR03118 family protein n=1 Tax=Satyrvirus sp. TaxID=2487771 RepID=A0A3G5ACT9_9VIRU|nr:MAG: hypothetical protein Satyrvirus1_58 [Satyrvirus sp.]